MKAGKSKRSSPSPTPKSKPVSLKRKSASPAPSSATKSDVRKKVDAAPRPSSALKKRPAAEKRTKKSITPAPQPASAGRRKISESATPIIKRIRAMDRDVARTKRIVSAPPAEEMSAPVMPAAIIKAAAKEVIEPPKVSPPVV